MVAAVLWLQGGPALGRPIVAAHAVSAASAKHRLIVLTDIEADPDDTQSLVRLMLYANVIDIRGLIATTSTFLTDRVEPDSIRRVIAAYGAVQPSLARHEPGFPRPEALARIVSQGLPVYGMAAVGEGRDSPGSDAIIAELRKADPRPLWVSIWGGSNVLAQALWKIRHDDKAAEAERLYAKLRVHASGDQDDSGAWIRREFPSVFYIEMPFYSDPAPGGGAAKRPFETLVGSEWLEKNIQQGHGPLGAIYPDTAYGNEGDTRCFLNLIPNGLSDPEHPDFGGWGGRYAHYTPVFTQWGWRQRGEDKVKPQPETRPFWTKAIDVFVADDGKRTYGRAPEPAEMFNASTSSIDRWREEVQNDFAARMAWTTTSPDKANHPPVAVVNGPHALTVHSGEVFRLDATGSHDPDGDSLSYRWMPYREAGSYPLAFDFSFFAQNLRSMPVTAPSVGKPETIHFILKVTDKGMPRLTRYQRVIVTVLPGKAP